VSTARQRRHFEIYPLEHDPRFQRPSFRWRLKAGNGVVIIGCHKSFKSVAMARKDIKLIRRNIALAGVIMLDSKGKVSYEA
jgi:uncharacterized protein YegP (UPF0339 family)